MSDRLSAQVDGALRIRPAPWRNVVIALVCGSALSGTGLIDMTRQAQASCGEYLLINGRPASFYHQPVVGRMLAQHLPSRHAPAQGLPTPRFPCGGPHCSKQIPLPISQDLPTLQLRGAEQWASLIVESDDFLPTPWAAAFWLRQTAIQDVCAPRLDRPPRG